MKSNSLWGTIWTSVTEAGFVAGLISTVAQLSGWSGIQTTILFLLSLVILSFTIFNVRLFYINKSQQPLVYFVNGHNATFELLTNLVKNAKESIWVTRFSKGGAIGADEYFDWSNRRILGKGCAPLFIYRRIMRSVPENARFISDLIQLAGSHENLYLSETQLTLFLSYFLRMENARFLYSLTKIKVAL